MRQIELSIIIPVYNAEKYIGRSIQSILASTEERVEVIAIDDGSKDASLQICQELMQVRYFPISTQKKCWLNIVRKV